MPIIPTLYTYARKYVGIHSYFQIQKASIRGKFGKHSHKQSICSISKGSNYSSGLSFATKDGGEIWMKFMTQFTKEHVLSLLQKAVDTLWYTICKHLL